jgi:hypothetical protein
VIGYPDRARDVHRHQRWRVGMMTPGSGGQGMLANERYRGWSEEDRDGTMVLCTDAQGAKEAAGRLWKRVD